MCLLGTFLYYAGRKPGKLEGIAFGVFFAVWLLSPNFVIQIFRFLSRYTAVFSILACGNALVRQVHMRTLPQLLQNFTQFSASLSNPPFEIRSLPELLKVMDIDVTAVFLFLATVIELFWRPASTTSPLLAILSTIVFACLLLVVIGYILEHPAMLAESVFMVDGNMIGAAPVLLAIVFILLDWIGSYAIPSFIYTWTMPLSWVCLGVLVLAFVVLGVFARQIYLIGIFALSTLLGFFLMPYLPFKLVAFFTSCAYSALLSTSIYCLEIIATENNVRSSWPYELASFACLIIDFSSGHYASLSGAQWTRFSGVLAANGVVCVFFLVGLVPALKQHIAQKQNQPPAN